jgi:Flp pilus assembly protein TadG
VLRWPDNQICVCFSWTRLLVRSRFRSVRQAGSDQGSAAVETALSIMLLLTAVFGVFEISLALYSYHFISDAAREGARYAIVRGADCAAPCTQATAANIQTHVQNLGYPGINPNKIAVATTWASSNTGASWTACAGVCNSPGNLVEVTATYTFPLSIPFVPATTLTLTSTSEMVISQ